MEGVTVTAAALVFEGEDFKDDSHQRDGRGWNLMRSQAGSCRGKRREWSKSGLGEQAGVFSTFRPGDMRTLGTRGRVDCS